MMSSINRIHHQSQYFMQFCVFIVSHYFLVSHHDHSCSQLPYECQLMTALKTPVNDEFYKYN